MTALAAGAASLAGPDREPPPPPATTPSANAAVHIPPAALLRPEDITAGAQVQPGDEEDAMPAVRYDYLLEACFR